MILTTVEDHPLFVTLVPDKIMESGEKYGHVTSLAFLNCLTHYGMGWDGMGWGLVFVHGT
jgi:hypothetical protein